MQGYCGPCGVTYATLDELHLHGRICGTPPIPVELLSGGELGVPSPHASSPPASTP